MVFVDKMANALKKGLLWLLIATGAAIFLEQLFVVIYDATAGFGAGTVLGAVFTLLIELAGVAYLIVTHVKGDEKRFGLALAIFFSFVFIRAIISCASDLFAWWNDALFIITHIFELVVIIAIIIEGILVFKGIVGDKNDSDLFMKILPLIALSAQFLIFIFYIVEACMGAAWSIIAIPLVTSAEILLFIAWFLSDGEGKESAPEKTVEDKPAE